MVKFAACKPGDDEGWYMCYTGQSMRGVEYIVEIRGVHGDEIPLEVSDAKDTAELIAKLLNEHFGLSE